MWLVEITIGGILHRVSTESAALEHFWDGLIIGFSPLSYSMREETGGYIEPRFGGASFSPELFKENWPPPAHLEIDVKYTDSDEAAAIEVFSGFAHRNRIGRESIDYDFFGGAYTETILSTAVSGTLSEVFADYCGATHLDLTLDTSAARSPSPSLSIPSSTSDLPVIDMLSKAAAATNHCFYIELGTLYLIDMLADNGTSTITEFDFLPAEYLDKPSISLFRSGASSLAGTYPHGEVKDLPIDEFVTSGNIATHLSGAKTILERLDINITMPTNSGLFSVFGKKYTWLDESQGPDGENISGSMWVRGVSVGEDGEFVTLTGDGEIS